MASPIAMRGMMWDKLFEGKTADVIITADTPTWLDTVLSRKPARRVIKNQVLGFCGIKTKHCLQEPYLVWVSYLIQNIQNNNADTSGKTNKTN